MSKILHFEYTLDCDNCCNQMKESDIHVCENCQSVVCPGCINQCCDDPYFEETVKMKKFIWFNSDSVQAHIVNASTEDRAVQTIMQYRIHGLFEPGQDIIECVDEESRRVGI